MEFHNQRHSHFQIYTENIFFSHLKNQFLKNTERGLLVRGSIKTGKKGKTNLKKKTERNNSLNMLIEFKGYEVLVLRYSSWNIRCGEGLLVSIIAVAHLNLIFVELSYLFSRKLQKTSLLYCKDAAGSYYSSQEIQKTLWCQN